jgi:predicted RNA-binding Zn ribbon-like protein
VSHKDLPFRWLGGRLCLDFANTVAWYSATEGDSASAPRPEYERLTEFGRLVEWAQEAGILPAAQSAILGAAAASDLASAERALQTATALRDAIHRLFVAASAGRGADVSALSFLDAVVRRALAHRHLAPAAQGFVWRSENKDHSLEAPLWPIAMDAADLLTSVDLMRVRQCAGDDCGFLFLDRGRGPGRRWCTMAHCGNRAKARRHHRRIRARE